jgi:hypothetical protein
VADEHEAVAVVARDQAVQSGLVEAGRQRVVLEQRDSELGGRELGRLEGAHEGARNDAVRPDPERAQRSPGIAGLTLALCYEGALGVVETGESPRDRGSMSQKYDSHWAYRTGAAGDDP